MAKIIYGDIVTEINGSIGGITYQSNRGGKIARLKPCPCKSRTISQNSQNVNFTYYVQLFNNLSHEDKLLWLAFADAHTFTNRSGNIKRINGFNFFFLINQNRSNFSLPILSQPPGYIVGSTVGWYNVNLFNDKMVIAFDLPQDIASDGALIFTTAPFRKITNSFNRYLKLTKIEDVVSFQNIDITTAWQTTHSMSYPFSIVADIYTIGVMILYIRKDTGLSSVGLRRIGASLGRTYGIGDMIIGDDFIVS